MRAAVFVGEGRIEVRDAPDPEPGAGELLLEVIACGICGSDRSAWDRGSATTPGHETAGRVVGRGSGTTTAEGTTGSVFLVAWCGECPRCRDGARGACLAREGMLGFDRDGGFADRIVIPERCFLPLAPGLDPETAVLLLDVTGTALHALRRAGAFHVPPPAALVMGAGPLGLGCILALRAVGVARVISVDVAARRLELAGELGATAVTGGVGADERVRAVLPDGPPLVLEASGNPHAQRQALDLLAPGGRLVLLGHSPAGLAVSASRDLIGPEKTLLGSEYFDPSEHAENQRLVLDGLLDPSGVVTHRYGLERLEEAYRRFWSGETGKVLIYPQGGAGA